MTLNSDQDILIFENIENICSCSLIIDKKCVKDTYTVNYEIRHITENSGYKKDPLCIRLFDVDAYFAEKNENKHLVLALTKNNKGGLKPYIKLWNWVEKQTGTVNNNK